MKKRPSKEELTPEQQERKEIADKWERLLKEIDKDATKFVYRRMFLNG